MIELIRERLSPALEQKLRRWLSQPEADTLRRVIYAQCQFHQAEALEKALDAKPGAADSLLSQDAIKQAARYHDFLEILREFTNAGEGQHFHIAKLKSAITNATINTSNESGQED